MTFVRVVCLINWALNKQEIAVNIIFYAPKFLRHKSLERPYMVLTHMEGVWFIFFLYKVSWLFPCNFYSIFRFSPISYSHISITAADVVCVFTEPLILFILNWGFSKNNIGIIGQDWLWDKLPAPPNLGYES